MAAQSRFLRFISGRSIARPRLRAGEAFDGVAINRVDRQYPLIGVNGAVQSVDPLRHLAQQVERGDVLGVNG